MSYLETIIPSLNINPFIYTIAHSWHDSHFTSISTCRVKGARAKIRLQEGVSHTYTLKLSYS